MSRRPAPQVSPVVATYRRDCPQHCESIVPMEVGAGASHPSSSTILRLVLRDGGDLLEPVSRGSELRHIQRLAMAAHPLCHVVKAELDHLQVAAQL
eukprot:CAMPEP_0184384208 /NCGR_PEP_ID=MMETSP0007-20130409/7750_1 /TAXON_ID=97485 /ORGANISM="Prymnesium parvum, Strain Texoma1" /LENGTH=95 /DNA_ID=CAMNT_0026731007 /DNA_START=190 /DNA_END=474 /DNA_ORIENTATION=-